MFIVVLLLVLTPFSIIKQNVDKVLQKQYFPGLFHQTVVELAD